MFSSSSWEAAVLVATARVHLSKPDVERLHIASERADNWIEIVRAAMEHGTCALLCHHLVKTAPDLLSLELREAAVEFLDSSRKANSAATGELLQIIDALREAGVAAIPYKGPALAQAAYGDLAFRGFRDLDLLIHEGDIQQTTVVLEGLGYHSNFGTVKDQHLRAFRRANGQDNFFADGRMPVEPHWAFAPRSQGVDLDPTGVWARALPLSLAGRTIQSLSPEDMLIVLTLHGAKERWRRLIWITDVSETLRSFPDLDWEAVLARANESGLRRAVLLGVALANDMLCAPVPDRIRQMAEADSACLALVNQVRRSIFYQANAETTIDALIYKWSTLNRPQDKIRLIFYYLSEPRLEHMTMISLPAGFSWAYPVIRLATRLKKDPKRKKLWRM